MWSMISGAQLDHCLDEGIELILIDLREPSDFAKGHILGARNIPSEKLPGKIKELPRGQMIVLYCYHGPQSMRMARWLDQRGYYAADLYGGVASYRGKYYMETDENGH